ncbi:MAG: hypothetical protein NTZ74_00740 [Chloroflexi bacterium]|nr:hypothetical protein [Chloroflexota bacterium]
MSNRPKEKAGANWKLCTENCLANYDDDYNYCIDNLGKTYLDYCSDQYLCPAVPQL